MKQTASPKAGSILNFQIFSDDNELNQIQEEQASVDVTVPEVKEESKNEAEPKSSLGENVINIGTLKENLAFLKKAR